MHLYGVDRNGNRVFMGNTTFNVSYMSVQKIQVKNLNNGTGTFDVFLVGITAPSGVSKVQVPVWSKADQSDLLVYSDKTERWKLCCTGKYKESWL